MIDKYAKKRAAILKKYGGSTWAWHFPISGELIVRSKTTGKIKNLGHIDAGPHLPPVAMPEIRGKDLLR